MILLAYFVLFIVPPVSSFSFTAAPPVSADNASYFWQGTSSRQAELFLLDIIVWQQFKKTRQSEFLAPCDGVRMLPDRVPVSHNQYVASAASSLQLLRTDDIGRCTAVSRRSRPSSIRFLRSGVSPPVFLS